MHNKKTRSLAHTRNYLNILWFVIMYRDGVINLEFNKGIKFTKPYNKTLLRIIDTYMHFLRKCIPYRFNIV